MKILIDIGHPAHVHYFRNFIKIMEEKGHEFLIIAKNRNIVPYLLNYYKTEFVLRPDFPSNIIGKLINIPKADLFVLKNAIKYQPDIFLGFSGTFISHVGFILKKPRIVFDDTEQAKLAHLSYKSFATNILTPNCFRKDFGKKQIRFNGYMELCYLHPNYFTPDSSILDLLKVKRNEKYVIMRFVSWNASHDVGHSGLSIEIKRKAVKELSKYAKVFISSEGELPADLKKYQIKIPPERMHDALAFASLYIGESPTMTTESAVLGTPAICISSWACNLGNFQELKKFDLIQCYMPQDENLSLSSAIELLKDSNSKKEWNEKRDILIKSKIDVTAFIVWFIENYPKSIQELNNNKQIESKFKINRKVYYEKNH